MPRDRTRRACVWLAAVASPAICTLAWAEDAKVVHSHLPWAMPVPGEGDAGDFGLTGDWWGVRSSLHDSGIDFRGQLTMDSAWNVHGGNKTGFDFLSLLNLDLVVRTEPLLGWKGGRFFVSFVGYLETTNPASLVDTYWAWDALTSGIGNFVQVSELWYEQEFFDGHCRVRFGKQDANTSFAFVPESGGFISSATTYPATLQQYFPTYPSQAVGLEFLVRPTEWLSARLGVFDGTTTYFDAERGTTWANTGTRGPESFFHNPGSWFTIGEVDASWNLGKDPHPGRAAIGGWWHTGPVGFEVEELYVTEGSGGFFVTGAQTIMNLAADSRATRRVSLFGQLGLGEAGSNPAVLSLIGGVSSTGLLPGRDDDQTGIQANYIQFTNDSRVWANPGSSTVGIEAFYRVQLSPSLAIQPDIQWIAQPNGDSSVGDAILLTLRVQMSF